jgi:hypothetical protein
MADDGIHPKDLGHKVLADLAVFLIQKTAKSLVHRPIDSSDLEQLAEKIPDPMYQGNVFGQFFSPLTD